MTRHSKNNTSLGHFTKAESDQLRQEYGTIKKRLEKESIKQFDSCSICLSQAVQPVSCNYGHLFCRECVLKNLLKQRKSLRKIHEKQRRLIEENEKKDAENKKQDEINAVKKFEKHNDSILPNTSNSKNTKSKNSNKNFACFWVPSVVANSSVNSIKKSEKTEKTQKNEKILKTEKTKKSRPVCPRFAKGKRSHFIALKTLQKIIFKENRGNSLKKNYSCFVCQKRLQNTIPTVAVRPCGHVQCKQCFDRLQKAEQSKECLVCQKTMQSYVELEVGGSGFAAHGNTIESEKFSQPFVQ